MEIASQDLGAYEIAGDYNPTVQWLIEEEFTITENTSLFHDWFFMEEFQVTEAYAFKIGQFFSDILTTADSIAYQFRKPELIRDLSNVWNKTKRLFNKDKP